MSAPGQAAFETITPPPTALRSISKMSALVKVEHWFQGPGNLIGAAARMNGEPFIFYLDPAGNTMISGVVLDINTQRNMTIDATEHFFAEEMSAKKTQAARQRIDAADRAGVKALPNPEPLPPGLSQDLEKLAYIATGDKNSQRKAYILFDFECRYCQTAFNQLSTQKLTGQIRWVPLATGGLASEAKAAYALATGDLKGGFTLTKEALQKKIAQLQNEFARSGAKLTANTDFSTQIGLKATPTFVYQHKGAWVMHRGFAALANLPNELGVGQAASTTSH